MEDSFKAFLWFGVALALVIVGTMAILGRVSLGELMSNRQGKLTEQVTLLQKTIQQEKSSLERSQDLLQRVLKKNAEAESRLSERLQVIEQYEELQDDLADAEDTRLSLHLQYAKNRQEILKNTLGTEVDVFTTADGREFKNVTIVSDNGKRVSFRSEFGGRSFTYEELSQDIQELLGISPFIEDSIARLIEKPKPDKAKSRVTKRLQPAVDKSPSPPDPRSVRIEEAKEQYKDLNKLVRKQLSEADRLDREEMRSTIKSADRRNRIQHLRNSADNSRSAMESLQEEISKLYKEMKSKK